MPAPRLGRFLSPASVPPERGRVLRSRSLNETAFFLLQWTVSYAMGEDAPMILTACFTKEGAQALSAWVRNDKALHAMHSQIELKLSGRNRIANPSVVRAFSK